LHSDIPHSPKQIGPLTHVRYGLGLSAKGNRSLSTTAGSSHVDYIVIGPIPTTRRIGTHAGERSDQALEGENMLRTKVFAYRLGDLIAIGPEPTPQDEFVFLLANEGDEAFKGLAKSQWAQSMVTQPPEQQTPECSSFPRSLSTMALGWPDRRTLHRSAAGQTRHRRGWRSSRRCTLSLRANSSGVASRRTGHGRTAGQ